MELILQLACMLDWVQSCHAHGKQPSATQLGVKTGVAIHDSQQLPHSHFKTTSHTL